MAPLALPRRRLVEEHLFVFNRPHFFVASFTADVLVQTLQGERRPLVVIEK